MNTQSQFVLREARPEDLDELVDFQIRMALESENLHLDRATCTSGLEALFENPLLGKYHVICEADGTLIGCLLITFEWSDWRNGHLWWIQSVYVRPESRGQKVFSKLYRHMQKLVMADPLARGLRLYVEQDNTKAQEIYKKLGLDMGRYIVGEWLRTPDSFGEPYLDT